MIGGQLWRLINIGSYWRMIHRELKGRKENWVSGGALLKFFNKCLSCCSSLKRLYPTCWWYLTTWNPYVNTELKIAFPDKDYPIILAVVYIPTCFTDPVPVYILIKSGHPKAATTHSTMIDICYTTFPGIWRLTCDLSSGSIYNSYLALAQDKRNTWMVAVAMRTKNFFYWKYVNMEV